MEICRNQEMVIKRLQIMYNPKAKQYEVAYSGDRKNETQAILFHRNRKLTGGCP